MSRETTREFPLFSVDDWPSSRLLRDSEQINWGIPADSGKPQMAIPERVFFTAASLNLRETYTASGRRAHFGSLQFTRRDASATLLGSANAAVTFRLGQ